MFKAALEMEYGAATGIPKSDAKSRSAIPVLKEITFLIADFRRSGKKAVIVLTTPVTFISKDLSKSARKEGRSFSL
jgi:hypothetical protein